MHIKHDPYGPSGGPIVLPVNITTYILLIVGIILLLSTFLYLYIRRPFLKEKYMKSRIGKLFLIDLIIFASSGLSYLFKYIFI